MVQAEIETEIVQLKARVSQIEQREDDRKQRWRPIGFVSVGLALFLAILAIGFTGADIAMDMQKTAPSAHQYVQIMALQALFVSVALGLLGQALLIVVRKP